MKTASLAKKVINKKIPYLYLRSGKSEITGYKVFKGNEAKFQYYEYEIKWNDNIVILTSIKDDIYRPIHYKTDSDVFNYLEDALKDDIDRLKEFYGVDESQELLQKLISILSNGKPGYISEEHLAPETFKDYPEKVRIISNEIIELSRKNGTDLFQVFMRILDMLHYGDKKAKGIVLLSLATPFIEKAKPVHQALQGSSGSGKTNLALSAAELIPSRFVKILRSSSSLYIYYASEKNSFREDYNIMIFDDIELSHELIATTKYITDNRVENKIHHTVRDQKAISLKIPGKCLAIFTRARDIHDDELRNRLLFNNPKEDERHEKYVKEKIKEREIMDNIEHIRQTYREVARAIFEKLIEEPIQVYNPWLLLVDVNLMGKRDIEIFSNLVKAMTFYRRFKRKYIRGNIVLGTKEDLRDVITLWSELSLLQVFKISRKQEKLFDILKPYPYMLEEYRDQWKNDPSDFLADDKPPTVKNLSLKVGVSRSTMRSWLEGSGSSMGLIDTGVVVREKMDPAVSNSPVLYYLRDPNVINFETDKGLIQPYSKSDEFVTFSNIPKEHLARHYINYTLNIDSDRVDKLVKEACETYEEEIKEDNDVIKFLRHIDELTIKERMNQSHISTDITKILTRLIDEKIDILDGSLGRKPIQNKDKKLEKNNTLVVENKKTEKSIISTNRNKTIKSNVDNHEHDNIKKQIYKIITKKGTKLSKIIEIFGIDKNEEILTTIAKLKIEGKIIEPKIGILKRVEEG